MKLPGDLSAFRLLDARLDMLEVRQRTIAENVANANTPGYVPRDVDMNSFERSLEKVARSTSDSSGNGIGAASPKVSTTRRPDSETTIDGNAVVLEEQMLRLNQTRTDFETALSLYEKGLALLKMAARSPN